MVRQRRKSFYDASKRISDTAEFYNQITRQARKERKQNHRSDSKLENHSKQKSTSKKTNRGIEKQNRNKENAPKDKQARELAQFVSPNKISMFTPEVKLRRLSLATINRIIDGCENQYKDRLKTPVDLNDNRIERHSSQSQSLASDISIQANDTDDLNQSQPVEPLPLQQAKTTMNSPVDSLSIVFSHDNVSSIGADSEHSSEVSEQNERRLQLDGERPEEFQDGENVQDSIEKNVSTSSDQSQLDLIPSKFNRVPWNSYELNSNTSFHSSIIAGISTSNNESLSQSNVSEPSKCFIDSPKVSFSPIINFEDVSFAINYFDHNDEGIEHHFLSKFDRIHFSALRTFEKTLWVTETTGRLISKYSLIDHSCIKVMGYGEAITIGNITVTAIEVPKFPGGAIFLFQSPTEKNILHVGNFRLPNELEMNMILTSHEIHEIYFDRSLLSQLLYQFPTYTDRYQKLMDEITRFIDSNVGNLYLIAVGAFEIGMEYFIYELSQHCRSRIYVDEERHKFLRHMEGDNVSDTLIQRLRRQTVKVSVLAKIHVFNVDEINEHFLLKYIRLHNYHRVLGIRPRGHNAAPKTLLEVRNCKILDIANPLIGDTDEYEKFVKLNVHE